MRKAADEGLTKSSTREFYETQTKEAVLLACDWLNKPAKWDQHLRRTTTSTMLSVLYDYPTITSEQDHTVALIDDVAMRVFHAASPGAHLVEYFPWMRHIPSR
jgi:hypothetical protein